MQLRRALLALPLAGTFVLSGLACGAPPGPASPAPAASTLRAPVAAGSASASPSSAPSASAAAPAPAKPGHGLLSVHTTPPGAMVIIEGGVLAQTPIDRLDIEAGKHQMLIALPGYEAIGTSVTVVAGEHVVHETLLTPAGAASRGGSGGGDDDSGSGCSESLCRRDCFREHFHCESDCGFCTDCSSPVDGSASDCAVCLACKNTCKQLERACERGCDACN